MGFLVKRCSVLFSQDTGSHLASAGVGKEVAPLVDRYCDTSNAPLNAEPAHTVSAIAAIDAFKLPIEAPGVLSALYAESKVSSTITVDNISNEGGVVNWFLGTPVPQWGRHSSG
jgi:hypothetical protein